MNDKLYGAIEAGGTKFICAVGSSPDKITEQSTIATTSPSETLENVISFFKQSPTIQSLGIASFGPIDVNKESATYGYITTTPKDGWQNVDLLNSIKNALNVPTVIDTDVNGAALGEQLYGGGRGLDNLAYVTVGTGIGVGCIVNNKPIKGLTHAESGHTLIPRVEADDSESCCPYHSNCLEGMASGTALHKRWGQIAQNIHESQAWEFEAKYLAYGLVNIIIGGGVMNHAGLIEDVRRNVKATLNGYVKLPEILDQIDNYIVSPELGVLSGITGALSLAVNL
jgi:fructokinase